MKLKDEHGKYTDNSKEWFGVGLLYVIPGVGLIYNLYRGWKREGKQVGKMTPVLWVAVGLLIFIVLFTLSIPLLAH